MTGIANNRFFVVILGILKFIFGRKDDHFFFTLNLLHNIFNWNAEKSPSLNPCFQDDGFDGWGLDAVEGIKTKLASSTLDEKIAKIRRKRKQNVSCVFLLRNVLL